MFEINVNFSIIFINRLNKAETSEDQLDISFGSFGYSISSRNIFSSAHFGCSPSWNINVFVNDVALR